MTADAPVEIQVMRVGDSSDLPLPEPATAWSSGFDLRARLDAPLEVQPGTRVLVPSGIALALPVGFEAQVRPRSGLALKHGITLLNSPGTIDADYRGEIAAIVVHHGHEPLTIRRGDRIAQLVVQRVPRIVMREVSELPDSKRGDGGFGHTGAR